MHTVKNALASLLSKQMYQFENVPISLSKSTIRTSDIFKINAYKMLINLPFMCIRSVHLRRASPGAILVN